MNILFSILLLPFKLIAKIILYFFSNLIILFALIIKAITSLAKVICVITAIFGVIYATYLFSQINSFKEFYLLILPLYCMSVLIFLIPVIGEKICEKFLSVSAFLKNVASFNLINNKSKHKSAVFINLDKYNSQQEDTNCQSDDLSQVNNQNVFFPFEGVTTLEELKNRYQQLAKYFHPDVSSGDTIGAMQYINYEYERLKNILTN